MEACLKATPVGLRLSTTKTQVMYYVFCCWLLSVINNQIECFNSFNW